MQNDLALGLNYLGTIDDMVLRYPWRFKLTSSGLNASLALQLIDGRPIVLNDGYLVNHPLARAALMDSDSLLWALMRIGFVRVMARGGERYRLDEMPERMSRTIASFGHLVHDQVDGVRWSELKAALSNADASLRRQGYLLDWPPFDAGSGYRALAVRLDDRLAQRLTTTHSLGIGRVVSNTVFRDFLAEYLARMHKDTTGARNHWEILARKYASTSANTGPRDVFVHALMGLGNEMYHYNMGIMLTAQHGGRVSVETQASAAFDDLLMSPDIYLDELAAYPRLNVPSVIATAPPSVLVRILDWDRPVSKARQDWMQQRERWENAHGGGRAPTPADRLALTADAREAGRRYARELSKLLGGEVKYDKGEGLFNFAVGAATKAPSAKIVAAVGAGIAAGVASGNAQVAWAAGIATGWVVSTAQKKLLNNVTKRFKIRLLENQIVPPDIVQRSLRAVARIKARKLPSSIDIDPVMAATLAGRLEPFKP